MVYDDPSDFWHGGVPLNCSVSIIEARDNGVNEFLAEETASGRIDELAEEYIYRYVRQETDEAA